MEETVSFKQGFKEIGAGFKRGFNMFKSSTKNSIKRVGSFFKSKKDKVRNYFDSKKDKVRNYFDSKKEAKRIKKENKMYEQKLNNSIILHKDKQDIIESENKIQFFEKIYIIKSDIVLTDPRFQKRMDMIREDFKYYAKKELNGKLGYKNLFVEEDYQSFTSEDNKIHTLILKGGINK